MELDVQSGLVTTVTALIGVVAVLWRIVDSARLENAKKHQRCEEELNKLWTKLLDIKLGQS